MRVWLVAAGLALVACDPSGVVVDHRGDAGIPPSRAGASSAYDAANGTIVMFGGANASGVLDDTWTWDGAVWREQHPAHSPSAREFAYMAFDSAASRMVLFGGGTCQTPAANDPIGCEYQRASTNLADTWSWDGGDWSLLKTAHTPPVFDFRGDFGGMADDATHGRLVLVTYGPPDPDYRVETWTLRNGDWQRLHPRSSPLAYAFSGPTFDAVSGRVIVQQEAPPHIDYAQGVVPPPTFFGDKTWSWDGSDWQDLGRGAKTPHTYGQLVAAGPHGLLIIWLGAYTVWNGKSWSTGAQLPQSISPYPPSRDEFTAAYHEPTGRLIMFGGRAGAGSNHLLADTVGWDGTSWTTVIPAPPSPIVSLRTCSARAAQTGYGGGGIVPNEPSGAAMEVDFFEPRSGPCHLQVDVVLTLVGRDGAVLKIKGNPDIQHLNADLTWDAGGQAVVFDAKGICVFGPNLTAKIHAGDDDFAYPFFGSSPCQMASPPPPSLTSWVVPTGLRP